VGPEKDVRQDSGDLSALSRAVSKRVDCLIGPFGVDPEVKKV